MENVVTQECQFFYEDEICRINDKTGKIQFGIILENSEYAPSEDESDSENEENQKLSRGEIRISWHPSGKENIVSEKKVYLADRCLMPGDVVAKLNQQGKICGYCRQVKSFASVRILGTDKVICDVKSEDLHPLEEFSPDIAVSLDNWVGMARSVKFKVFLRTKDGSLCSMDDHQAMELQNIHNKYSKDSEFHHDEFYPGQVLVGNLSMFDGVKWLEGGPDKISEGNKKVKRKIVIKATVEKVEVQSLGVKWQCQSWAGNDGAPVDRQPDFFVDGENLKRVKMLNIFEPCTLQLGDKSFYDLKSTDVPISMHDWNLLQVKKLIPECNVKKSGKSVQNNAVDRGIEKLDQDLPANSSANGSISQSGRTKRGGNIGVSVPTRSFKKRKLRKAKIKRNDPSSSNAPLAPDRRLVVETLCTYSWVDVVWQDGSIELGISSQALIPVHHLDDKEFFPGDLVVASDSCTNVGLMEYGVIQSVNAHARTALVQWMKSYAKAESIKPEILETNEVSVYDLKDHPDFKFRPGSIIVRVAEPEDSPNQVGTAGQVLDNLPTGKVEVWWTTGNKTFCWPQELYRVGDYDSEAGELWDNDAEFDDVDDHSQGSWETESQVSISGDICEETNSSPASAQERLSVNLEKARNALQLLITLLDTQNQACDSSSPLKVEEILKVLIDIYKQCRYLDRLMGSSYFHERHFEGLLEKVCPTELVRFSCLSDHLQYFLKFFGEGNLTSGSHDGIPPESCKDDDCALKPFLLSSPAMKESNESSLTEEAHQKLLQACIRLSQLLTSQLSSSAEEMSRKCEKESELTSIAEEASNHVSPQTKSNGLLSQSETMELDAQTGKSGFTVLENAPIYHKFFANLNQPVDPKHFQKSLREELSLLGSSLPLGIHVKTFEDRMDLFSVMIEGPSKTPYEGGLFLFDFQLPGDYPRSPPACHYWSYCSERLNPNLYEEGKVCISLLGTWSGKGSEVWGPGSNLLQVLVSIQGLILVSEPYYNEAGYEKQRGSSQARENSRLYNEMVLLKMLQAMSSLAQNPPEIWATEVLEFFHKESSLLIGRYQQWLKLSVDEPTDAFPILETPAFPLIPASKGFCLTLNKSLQLFRHVIDTTLQTYLFSNQEERKGQ